MDDCTAKYTDNPTKSDLKNLICLCIQTINHGHIKDVKTDRRSGQLSFYVAGVAEDMESWRLAVQQASSWWTRKSSLTTMKDIVRDRTNTSLSAKSITSRH